MCTIQWNQLLDFLTFDINTDIVYSHVASGAIKYVLLHNCLLTLRSDVVLR